MQLHADFALRSLKQYGAPCALRPAQLGVVYRAVPYAARIPRVSVCPRRARAVRQRYRRRLDLTRNRRCAPKTSEGKALRFGECH